MGAFPSGSGNHISETHLDAGTDKPKDARADLLSAVQRINQIIDSFNDGDGICGLNSSSKIDSAKLAGVIGTDQLVDDSVTTGKIASPTGSDTNVVTGTSGSSGKLVKWDGNGDAVDSGYIVENNDSLGTSDAKIPTQGNVKAYVDSAQSVSDIALFTGGSTGLTITNFGTYNYSLSQFTSSHSNFSTSNIRFIYVSCDVSTVDEYDGSGGGSVNVTLSARRSNGTASVSFIACQSYHANNSNQNNSFGFFPVPSDTVTFRVAVTGGDLENSNINVKVIGCMV